MLFSYFFHLRTLRLNLIHSRKEFWVIERLNLWVNVLVSSYFKPVSEEWDDVVYQVTPCALHRIERTVYILLFVNPAFSHSWSQNQIMMLRMTLFFLHTSVIVAFLYLCIEITFC